MKQYIIRIFALAVLLTALVGCAGLTDDMGVSPQVEQRGNEIQKDYDKLSNPNDGFFEVKEGYYMGGREVAIKVKTLPDYFEKKVRLKEELYLYGVADRVSRLFSVPVGLAPDIAENDLNDRSMPVDHTGSLKLLLDSVASYYGLYWKYEADNNMIQFYHTETRTYTLLSGPENLTVSSKLSNTSDSTGSAGSEVETTGSTSTSNEQTTITDAKTSIWDSAVDDIKGMIGDKDSVTANTAAGTITVTTTPGIQHRVKEYVDSVNAKLGRQVALNVKILSFTANDTRNRGIGTDIVYSDITGATISLASGDAVSTIDGLSSFAAGILEDAAQNDKLSAFYGSNLLIEALRTKGKVSVTNSLSGIVLNNSVLPIQELDRRGYLANVASTTSSSGDATTSELQAGQVVTGLAMQVTPHIMDDNKVIVNYHISLSTLNGIESVESGDQQIQFPDTSERSLLQRVMCKTGSTIVLAGFVQERLSDNETEGILSTGDGESRNKELLIIAIDVNEVSIS